MAKAKKDKKTASATVGYEAELWQMADALRGSMDAAEYKHVVLGLIFLKYISDAFEEHHAELAAQRAKGADPEDPDEYRAQNIFWVPPEARWSHLKSAAKQATIGQLVDDAMAGIERDNPSLKGVLPKDYARPALDKQRLGQLIDPSPRRFGCALASITALRSCDDGGRASRRLLRRLPLREGPAPTHRPHPVAFAPYQARLIRPHAHVNHRILENRPVYAASRMMQLRTSSSAASQLFQ